MPFRVRSILVASDLAPDENAVLRSASALAALAEASLHVIHAVEVNETSGAEGPRMEGRLQAADAALREQLRGAIQSTAEAGTSRVWPGRAHEVILRRAEDVDADLIIIGPHRQRDGQEEVLGTTADRLVRTSQVPCMIVRAPISLPLRRILVPTDFSPAAAGAMDLALIWSTALRLPRGSGQKTQLEVLHVLPPGPGGPAGGSPTAAETELRKQVDAGCRRTGCGEPLEIIESVGEGAAPAEEILRSVRAKNADLLVLGTHGEGAQERALIGSVSSTVARRAECPVLLCPPALARELSGRDPALSGG